MKNLLLIISFSVFTVSNYAQKSLPLYAITSDNNNLQWLNINLVDAANGTVLKSIFSTNQKNVQVIKSGTTSVVSKNQETEGPTESMVAAAAFSKAQNAIYFIPLRIPELRWADLSKGNPIYYSYQSPVLSNLDFNDAANHFTRMCMGADGYGYALTNDGNHLIRFTASAEPQIMDLGNLVDAPDNKDISIHNQSTSWGGDMIAGTDGKLFIISQRSYVFEFSPREKIVSLIGQIKNLPQNFTTNGAAVNENGDLIIACSNGNHPYFKVDMGSLTATAFLTQSSTGINSSDLASQFLMRRSVTNNGTYVENRIPITGQKISMYPNPVTNNRLQLIFDAVENGEYSIQLLDLSGKQLTNKVVTISGSGQISSMDLPLTLSRGVYLVKVLNHEFKTVFSDKVMLQ